MDLQELVYLSMEYVYVRDLVISPHRRDISHYVFFESRCQTSSNTEDIQFFVVLAWMQWVAMGGIAKNI